MPAGYIMPQNSYFVKKFWGLTQLASFPQYRFWLQLANFMRTCILKLDLIVQNFFEGTNPV